MISVVTVLQQAPNTIRQIHGPIETACALRTPVKQQGAHGDLWAFQISMAQRAIDRDPDRGDAILEGYDLIRLLEPLTCDDAVELGAKVDLIGEVVPLVVWESAFAAMAIMVDASKIFATPSIWNANVALGKSGSIR